MARQKFQAPDPGMIARTWRSVQLFWRLFNDPRVPGSTKAIVWVTLFYVISPIDFIPELFIPLIGELDDIAAVFLGIRLFIQMCPPEIVMEHQRALGGPVSAGAREEYVDATYRVVDDRESERGRNDPGSR